MQSSKLPYYLEFAILFVIGQSLVMFGSFISLPYKNLSTWEAIKMSLPFVWINWLFLTFANMLLHKYSLFTILCNYFNQQILFKTSDKCKRLFCNWNIDYCICNFKYPFIF